jgi:hypothetical protein
MEFASHFGFWQKQKVIEDLKGCDWKWVRNSFVLVVVVAPREYRKFEDEDDDEDESPTRFWSHPFSDVTRNSHFGYWSFSGTWNLELSIALSHCLVIVSLIPCSPVVVQRAAI